LETSRFPVLFFVRYSEDD